MIKTQVKFGECGHVAEISPCNYKRDRGCGVCKGKQVRQGVNDLVTTHPNLVGEWHPTKNGKLTPYGATHGSHKKVWWQCEKGHEWEAFVVNRVGGRGCPYCSNKKVLKGYNDLATTHPQFIRYFANIKDACTHTYSSNKKVKLNCPDCGHTKTMTINRLTQQGFSCDLCSDGVSYPEKLMASILSRLEVEFVKQVSCDGGYRYDFFIPKYRVIIETHGIQHYEQTNRMEARTLKEEQENDNYKRELAIKNGIIEENYYEIDCRYSTLKWCRPNIEKALSNYVDMSILADDDWREADIQAQKSLKVEVCKYWKESKEVDSELTIQQVADVFNITKTSVRTYLKWGNNNGFCNYSGEEELKARDKRRSKFVYLIKPDSKGKWLDEALSIKELSKRTKISQTTIGRNVDKGALKYNHSANYPKEFIGSYIVSAELYDSQTQSNQNT